MAEIPWNAPATAWLYVRGLERQRADLAGATLRQAVVFVLSQTNTRGDGYIVELEDKAARWEGPEILALSQRPDWPAE